MRFGPISPMMPARPNGVQFGSMDDLYKLRLQKHEDTLNQPAVQNVTLLQVLTAMKESQQESRVAYIEHAQFLIDLAEPEDRPALSQAVKKLLDLGMISPYSSNRTDLLKMSPLGEAAVRLLGGKPNSVL